MADEWQHHHPHHHLNDDGDGDDGDDGNDDNKGNGIEYRCVRERWPEKGRKSRKFTRRGARIPGYLVTRRGQDTWIPGF